MKTKEELNALKEEVETLNRKLRELTEEELELVTGGGSGSHWLDVGSVNDASGGGTVTLHNMSKIKEDEKYVK